MTVALENLLEKHEWMLTEAAVVEAMRRAPEVALHPQLEDTPLITERIGRAALSSLYFDFIEVAREAKTPLLVTAPTWRANRERVEAAGVTTDLNGAAVRFMQAIRNNAGDFADMIPIGGLVGCKNDCYLPDQALSPEEAYEFHIWQVERLAYAGADFLLATTLPSVEEAIGIAAAMSAADQPYLLSFVINRFGQVLDGTPFGEAIERIDSVCSERPLGYVVNCSYPTFLDPATLSPDTAPRLLGFQANASALDHCELEGADSVQAEPIEQWGDALIALHRAIGTKMLGGCCGTDVRHLRYLVEQLRS